ncbi:MAG: right-handed parallel beta-helix repeat-containing protein [Acidobacteria bacterium]|nr:right-handed parallel beta-helix repeat-containing protein [Acidobacteriota bacterium]
MNFLSRSVIRALVTSLLLAAGAQSQGPRGGGGNSTPDCSTFTLSPTTSAGLQTALDCATPGQTILLAPPPANYQGAFKLPNKSGSGWITIQSAAIAALPGAGVRVSPGNELAMAWLTALPGSAGPLLATSAGAHHYRFIGIKFSTPHWLDTLVLLGNNSEKSISDLPYHISFDRCYFAGSPAQGTKHGLTANGGQGVSADGPVSIVVQNSYFQDFKDRQNDAQAINVWNGAGPFLIENNYLEASGENVMFGGGDPTIRNLIPSNITIRRNHFYKPLAWVNQGWRIKNLFELKNASDVVVEANVFQNNWIEADQRGFAIVFTPRNQNGRAAWSSVRNVTFQNNLIRNSVAGFNLLGRDDTRRSGPLENVTIRDNLLLNIRPDAIPGAVPDPAFTQPGRLFQVMNGPKNVTIDHNTAFQAREVSFSVGAATSGFAFSDNVVRHNPCTGPYYNNCGIAGEGTAPGNATLSQYFASYAVTGNILFDGNDQLPDGSYRFPYPPGNQFPAAVSFESANIDLSSGLATDSLPADYDIAGANSTKPGVSWDAVLKPAIQGVVQACSEACSE